MAGAPPWRTRVGSAFDAPTSWSPVYPFIVQAVPPFVTVTLTTIVPAAPLESKTRPWSCPARQAAVEVRPADPLASRAAAADASTKTVRTLRTGTP